jgi:NADPH:quinone reductase
VAHHGQCTDVDDSRGNGLGERGPVATRKDLRMRAARLHDIGGTLRFDSNLPDPVAGEGEVVVDMVYASVNPLDIWVTKGAPGNAAAHLPWTPGTEGAGYFEGKPVIVRGAGLGVMRPGVYCDRIAVPAACVVPLPQEADLAQASALGVAGITAWQCVHGKGGVTAEDRVLVLGASGGVGIVAVQLAKATGATVWGQTTNAAKAAGIAAVGVDHVLVAPNASDLVPGLEGFEPTVILDPLGGLWTRPAIDAIAVGGRLVVFGTSDNEEVALNWRTMYRKGTQILGYSGLVDSPARQAEVLANLIALTTAGALRIPIGKILPLGRAAAAHDNILDRNVEGKQILDCRI